MSAHAGESGGDEANGDGRRNKRELSSSKRAAQNRAAQVCRSCDGRRRHFWLSGTWILIVDPSRRSWAIKTERLLTSDYSVRSGNEKNNISKTCKDVWKNLIS